MSGIEVLDDSDSDVKECSSPEKKRVRKEETDQPESADNENDDDNYEGDVDGEEDENNSSHNTSDSGVSDDNQAAEKALRDFSNITGQDEIFAQTILQDVNWNLQAALDVFYGSEAFASLRSEAVVGNSVQATSNRSVEPLPPGFELCLLSWNIDGLDGRSLATRMKAVKKIVSMVNADVVFLQEVVEREIEPIERLARLYNVFYSNRGAQYFTAIMVSKVMEVEKHDVVHYRNSMMGRTLQIVQGRLGDHMIFMLNTHLESCREHSNERRMQLAFCFDKIREIIRDHPDCLLFFGGDLNIRDEEIGTIPPGLADAWIAAGSDPRQRFTWDTRLNDNKDARGARMRFDRIMWYGALRTTKFSLEGRNRIRSCLCFPSDHWAVAATFCP